MLIRRIRPDQTPICYTLDLSWMLVWFSLLQSLDFSVMVSGFWYCSQLLSTREYNNTWFYVTFSSVRANLTTGLEIASTELQTEAACRQANALHFVCSLHEGFETQRGSQGLQSYGCQCQRIANARALIRNLSLFLLDQATSALDTQSERVVEAALNEAATKRTTICRPHRLSTLRHADVILVFADEGTAEQGTRGELQRMKRVYHEMCLAQSLDPA